MVHSGVAVGMIDLHCHILPGADDGSTTFAESCYMARLAASDGIRAIVATPHVCDGLYWNNRNIIAEKVSVLNNELKRAVISLKIVPGAEVQLTTKLADRLRRGEASTINNSRYVLISLPPAFRLEAAKDEIFALRMNGYIPILASAERFVKFRLDFECLSNFVGMGVFCQITAASLTGGFGREVRFVAEKMVLNGLVQILATDSHAASWRKPILSAAMKKAARLLGSSEKARRMVSDVPRAIIADRDIAREIPGNG